MKTPAFIFTLFAAAASLASCSAPAASQSEGNPADTACAEAVIHNIMTRTSVRRFTPEPIGKDTLETIVKAGMAAPTAMNRQPWAFVVVTDRAVLDSLESKRPHSNLKTATAAIIVCGDMDKTGPDLVREFWIQDCSAASENILLAAHAMGLGAVWCGVYPDSVAQSDVANVLGLPSNVVPLNIIAMGHPAAASEPKDKWDAARVHYQHW